MIFKATQKERAIQLIVVVALFVGILFAGPYFIPLFQSQ
jgi:hypothetical protein